MPAKAVVRDSFRTRPFPFDGQYSVRNQDFQILDPGAGQFRGQKEFLIELINIHGRVLATKTDAMEQSDIGQELIDFAFEIAKWIPGMSPAEDRHVVPFFAKARRVKNVRYRSASAVRQEGDANEKWLSFTSNANSVPALAANPGTTGNSTRTR